MPDKQRLCSANLLLLRSVWPFVLAVCLLAASMVASVHFLSSVRAYVGGESLWSKGQKQAFISLAAYAQSGSDHDYQTYLKAIAVPLGDRKARLALERAQADLAAARQGFVEGGNHPDDVPGMIRLFRYFHDTPLFARSVRSWTEGDAQIVRLATLGERLHADIRSGSLDERGKALYLRELDTINAAVTPLEDAFSQAIGDVSRQLEGWLSAFLLGLGGALLGLGMLLSRRLALRQVAAARAMEIESEKNAAFLRSASDGVHVLDAGGNVHEASDSFCTMLGYTRDEVIGMNVTTWDAHFSAEEIPGVLRRQIHRSGPSQFETVHRRKDGSVFDVEVSGMPVVLEGQSFLFYSSRDITERKATAKRLRDSERRFRHLFESSPDPVWIIDGRHFVECNQAAVNMLGYADKAALFNTHPSELSPQTQPDGESSLTKAERMIEMAQEKGLHRFEWVHTRKDGSDFCAEVTLSPAVLEGKEVIHCLWRDITDRKQAESKLQESERRFRSLFESSRDAILVQDGPVFIDCNQAALDLFGATDRAQVLGHTPAEFSLSDPVDPRPAAERAEEKMQAAIAGIPQFFEWSTRRLDGVEITLEIQLVRVDFDGRPHMQSICRDITDRKRAERALQRHQNELETLIEQRSGELFDTQFAMDKVGIGITWAHFDTGRFTYSNRYFAEFLGYSVEEVLQLSVPDIDPHFSAAHFSRTREEIKRRGHVQLETEQKTKDGRLIPVELAIYYHPARDASGARLIAFQTDISQRKTTERALVNAKEAAEAANRAKTAFLANMSHEIRTPLNAVTGMAYLMRRDGLPPEQTERLDRITVAGQHLLETIDAILDLSKIEAGQFILEEAAVCVADVVDAIQSMIRAQAERKGLRFGAEIAPGLPPLRGDATRLRQALLNYAANAVKFTEQGQITLRAEALETRADSVLLRFEVQDSGIGIPIDALPRLFNAFEQADSSTTRKYGGTGLGLAITRKIAQLMGGDAGVDSILGSGSRFWLTCRLKVDQSNHRAEAEDNTGASADTLLARNFAGTRVLLAEDEPVNRDVATLLFEDVGFEVDAAANGTDAVRLAREKDYGLILMDMQMPLMSGLDATREIRRDPRTAKLPILAMTANAFAEDENRCLAAGMNGFLTKPVDPDRLYSVMLELLSGR